jgi:hypothetical protein
MVPNGRALSENAERMLKGTGALGDRIFWSPATLRLCSSVVLLVLFVQSLFS